MKQILKFQLKGDFAHFNYPFTSPNKLKKSYSIPPRTTILGLLGSVIGLSGFQDFEGDEPDFYAKLKHIKMFISLNKIPLKKLITYNSLNSFANNINKNPNVMINEEILLNPKYEIGLLLDDEYDVDRKILEHINPDKVTSEYHIYLGKNEFFAIIDNVELFDEKNFLMEKKDFVEELDSIISKDLVDFGEQQDDVLIDVFSKNISYIDKKLKTLNEEIVLLLGDGKELYLNLPVELYKISDKYYYMF